MQDKTNGRIISRFSKEDQSILDKIEYLINVNDYIGAVQLIKSRLAKEFSYEDFINDFFHIELARLLIDAGSEGHIENIVREGIRELETYYRTCNVLTEGDFHYNIGIAKDSLFSILTNEPYFKIPENISYLIEAKDHYWTALKYYQNNEIEPPIQLYVNLGNVLYSCNRLTEAIQMYDIVLKKNPDFPQANINRSRCLLYLNIITETFTTNQLMQALMGFKKALKSEIYPITWRKIAQDMVKSLTKKLIELNVDINSYEHENIISRIEAQQHSEYRNFCIERKICLNEHSIYCNCAGARNDDLNISNKGIIGDFVPEMELVLNRIKSEFVLARWLFYEAKTSFSKVDEIINENVQYIELFEGEFIGAKSEMIRNSFRLCFGILDKIALAICKLFDLSKPNDNISFHTFWKRDNKPERWKKIKAIENPFIIALYTLATDLNQNGQLKYYKDWRNDLEHNVMILSNSEKNESFYFKKEDSNPIYKYVKVSQFIISTEHLLHLSASAIMYFVYAVRHVGLIIDEPSKLGTFQLNTKSKFANNTDVSRNTILN